MINKNTYKDKFKMIHSDNQNVLLEINTGKYYRLYDNEIIEGLNYLFNYDIENKIAIDTINSITTKNEEIDKSDDKIIINPKEFVIDRLAIILTSKCNLRCTYCYANYGMYEYKESCEMSMEDIKKIIDYFTKEFKGINTIQFFGGEPSLCVDEIEQTINLFNEKVEKKLIERIPKFSIVTNGLSISDKLINLILKNNIKVTLSLDGPKEVNDLTRRDLNGNGSYDRILKNYNKLKEAGIDGIDIECTYTNEHLALNISIVELIEYFNKTFGNNITHIVPVSIEDKDPLSIKNNELQFYRYIEEAIDYTFNQLLEKREVKSTAVIWGMFNNILLNKSRKEICPAGIGTFSVSHDLRISPCFMYTSENDLAYGKIGDDSYMILEKAYEFNNKINNKEKIDACKNCYAKALCSSCLGEFKTKNQSIELNSDVYCNMIKISIKNIMLKLANLKSDTNKWKYFTNILKGDNSER